MLVAALVPLPINVVSAAPRPQEIPATYQHVAENDLYALYVDSETLAFKLLDKRSNYLWHSGIDEPIEGDRLNKSWQAFARSGISIEYLDEKAINKRISIANTDHNLTLSTVDQGISAQLEFPGYGIALEVILQLEADGLRVEVPATSIRQDDPKYRLGSIYIYPFLGATRGASTPGYMFIPDGTGSLIHFTDSTKAKNMYYGRYYGPDLGMLGIVPYDPDVTSPYPINFPVFGMVHGEGENKSAFLSVVEKGAAYGEVQVHPAGVITNFNFLYNTFIYNQSYFQATNRSGAGVTTVQKKTNAFDAVVHYRFLTGGAADYVGMARSYQQYLVAADRLHKETDPNPNIGVRLEFLGGDWEKVLLWYRFVAMTTIQQMSEILDGLQIPNAQVIYYGWQPLGASTMTPTSLALESSLGSINDLRTIAEKIGAQGGSFSLYLDPQSALWEQSGYSARNDIAQAITNVSLEGYTRYPAYYFTLEALKRRYAETASSIASQLNVGLALDSIGSTLYSDFRQDAPLSREEAITAYQSLLAGSSLRLSFYHPNDYLFGLAQAYYDMPLGDNGYIYTSEAVPFLPIVLAGYLPYYGGAINFSSNLQEDLLRHVDYGIYPSYFVTYQPTTNMLNTPSYWIYTSSYAQWGDQIRDTYQWMNALLAPVRGQEIVARQAVAQDVYATTYANGKQIIVNYTDQPFVRNGITIAAKDAALVEVDTNVESKS
ncbi:MAG: hypothetical protein KF726_04465 [Anaerolineae bacterium]|nr:hypothetical protein [Anaerolineae bacterium]